MIKSLFLSILLLSSASAGDIYSFQIPGINGSATIDFSAFRGKKVLVVNTASASIWTKQYASLERLQEMFGDSLVVVAIPSNDFGNESGSEATIQQFIGANYHPQFLVSGLMPVSGDSASALYQWLRSGRGNGAISARVAGDFFKYLIDTSGHVVGYFAGPVDPMDTLLINRIRNN